MNDLDQATDSTSVDETSVPDQSAAASQESQQVDTQEEAGADTATGSEEAQADEPGSSTNPDTTSQTTKTEPPARDWQADLAKAEKQAADWRAKHNQSSNQLHDYRTKFEGVDPATVRQWKEAQAKAEKQNLPVWHKDNPKNAQFQQTKSNFKMYEDAMRRAETPEEKALAQKLLGPAFTQEDAEAIKAHRQHKDQFLERLAEDGYEAMRAEVRNQIREEISQERMEVQATEDVNGWMTAAENQPIVQKYGPQMLEALQRGNQWEFVRQMAVDRAKLEGLQSRVGTADKTTAHARAQSDLAKRKATHSRDGKLTPQKDVAAEVARVMKERGWGPSHPGIIDLIEQIQSTTKI